MERRNSLREFLDAHDNNYVFRPEVVEQHKPKTVSSLSIVIPYYETGKIVKKVVDNLYASLNIVQREYPEWEFEVLMLDDGSKESPLTKHVDFTELENLIIFTNKNNVGRSINRDMGLKMSKHSLVMFMDSDIVIDNHLVFNHLKTHELCFKSTGRESVSLSLFRYTNTKDPMLTNEVIHPGDVVINDWRVQCFYDSSWVGCEDDTEFIGQEISILKDTDNLKKWNGKYKAWMLSNMVLGGCFMVDRKTSLEVGGFDKSFEGYGFTETSLPTKLIALGQFIIPVVIGGALHVEAENLFLTKKEKDAIFKKKHQYYFEQYLSMGLDEAIENSL